MQKNLLCKELSRVICDSQYGKKNIYPFKKEKPKSILVAGGAGFLGSHLIERFLFQGHSVTCLDNLQTGRYSNIEHLEGVSDFQFIHHDVTHDLDHMGHFDQIYNLACPASPPQYQLNPVHTLMTNVMGAFNLLNLAEKCDARIFLASTSEVYGDPTIHPQSEGYRGNVSSTGPRACYDEGKRCAETLYFDFARTKNLDIRVARIFNTYGPNMDPKDGRVISNFIVQALKNENITVYGKGDQTRSFCYMNDLIDGFIDLMAFEDGFLGPLNLGNPHERTILELAETIIDMTGSKSKIVFKPLPIDDPVRRKPDISLAEETLGWRPKTGLRKGLASTISYFDNLLLHDGVNARLSMV